jgi:hypothetical protein
MTPPEEPIPGKDEPPPKLSRLEETRRITKRLELFFDRLFSLLNFFHAANHESRKIALHNFFFARFFTAKHLPRNLSLPLLRGLFILGAYTGSRLVEWKDKSRKKHSDQNEEINSAQIVAPIS